MIVEKSVPFGKKSRMCPLLSDQEFVVSCLMLKESKTAAELATMIRTRLGQEELRVAVFSDANGWHAKVYAAENVAADLQLRVNQAAQQLRKVHDLMN